jgi:DNA-binding transcriptional ArsR family regulator
MTAVPDSTMPGPTRPSPPDDCELRIVDHERVAATRPRLPGAAEIERLADWHRILADPTRIRLLYALVEAGEMCVCDLAATIGAAEATVSQSLRFLRSGGVVRSRRAGRMIYYTLDDVHVRLLLDLGREHLRHR